MKNEFDKEKRKSLTRLGAGILASSLPSLIMADEAMELVVDHVMFPVYFNNQFLKKQNDSATFAAQSNT